MKTELEMLEEAIHAANAVTQALDDLIMKNRNWAPVFKPVLSNLVDARCDMRGRINVIEKEKMAEKS